MIRRALAFLFVPVLLQAQPRFDTVTVRAQPLRGGVHMITGLGGNMGLSTGSDAAFLVDDQFGPLNQKILDAVKSVTNQPVKFVVNTHWHGDHTGGNENMAKGGSIIVAHDNVRRRMSTEQVSQLFNSRTPPSPAAALPVVTFTDSVTFHVNGDDLVAFHVPPAHTDGDVLVYFTKADVIHMGDTYMTISYPLVDLSSGGNVNGFITAADKALAVCGPQTMVIPGHGDLSNCTELRAWRDMIATVRDRVQAEMRQGKTLVQLQAAGITAAWDAKLAQGFVKPPMFIEMVYRSLGGQ